MYVMVMAAAKTESVTEFELTDDEIADMVTIFKALADPSRLQILATLARGEDVSVSDIAELLGMSVSRVSHHLTLLEHLGFVKATQESREHVSGQ
jgi:DNA-binding transcriptional ArsR family regulator